jgi:citrate synthase
MSAISKGLEGVVANDTRLGDVRGQEGQLVYCGYDIIELAGKASFEEVIYLLWHNRLPNRSELDELKKQLAAERQLPDQTVEFLKTTPQTALPIDVLRTAISMLGLHDPNSGYGWCGEGRHGAEDRKKAAAGDSVAGIVKGVTIWQL